MHVTKRDGLLGLGSQVGFSQTQFDPGTGIFLILFTLFLEHLTVHLGHTDEQEIRVSGLHLQRHVHESMNVSPTSYFLPLCSQPSVK